jgi:hypothetical protein
MQHRFVHALLIGSGVALAACGDGGGDDGGGAGMGGSAKGDYAAVSAILGGPEQSGSGSCAFVSSCHGGTGPGKANLNFKEGADLIETLVNVPACENDSMMRVKPGDPEHSWIWIKLTAEADPNTGMISPGGTPSKCTGVSTGFGTRMPQVSGFAKLSDDKLAIVKAWIEAGAPGPE